jgi:hypothetical protein
VIHDGLSVGWAIDSADCLMYIRSKGSTSDLHGCSYSSSSSTGEGDVGSNPVVLQRTP